MTNTELSTEFDVLYNNITSNQAPGLNDYEKSVFINKAQLQLVSEYFSKRLDGSEGGFDGSPKRQIDFSSIMEWSTLERVTQNIPRFDPRSILYAMPDDALFIVDEQLSLLDYSNISYSQADTDTFYSVVPISYEDYARLMSKPYKYPPKNQAWRLITKKQTLTTAVTPAYTSYETVHSKTSVYAINNGTAKLVFTFEYDSNVDNSNPVNIAIVMQGFDTSSLSGYSIYTITDPNEAIKLTLEDLFTGANINNLVIKIERDFAGRAWKQVFGATPTLIMQVTNSGSIATEHPEVPAETRDVQILEIIGKFASTPYYRMRYVRRPQSVILSSLAGLGVTIDGQTAVQSCELPEEVHKEILERAVTLAKIAWQGATMTQTALAVEASK